MNDGERGKPLVVRGERAIEQEDAAGLAVVLLELLKLERHESLLTAQVFAAQREDLSAPHALAIMARRLRDHDTPAVVREALFALGIVGAEALLQQLALAPDRVTRRVYLEALTEHPEATGPVLHALKGRDPRRLAAAAEVSGLRALELAIPALEVLLRHEDEGVRAAAYRALEQIGTPTAMAILNS